MINYSKLDKDLFKGKCKNNKYLPSIIPSKRRIIAIGDLHGDFDVTIRALKLGKVIDDNNNWNGKDTYVVQVGDQLDNFRPTPIPYKINDQEQSNTNENFDFDKVQDIKVFNYLTKLNEQAIKNSGAVISLLGNHEILNILGNFTYVSKDDVKNFKNYKDPLNPTKIFNSGEEARKHAFKLGNEYSKIMACTRLPAVIIGSFIFAHAGFIYESIDQLNIKIPNDLNRINYFFKKWLLGLPDKNYVVDIINNSNKSMFWNRILGSIPPNTNGKDPKCIKHISKVLEIFKVNAMIIGHTPQYFANKNGINSTCDKQLFRIDFGGSFSFDKFDDNYKLKGEKSKQRKVQILEILNDSEVKILSE